MLARRPPGIRAEEKTNKINQIFVAHHDENNYNVGFASVASRILLEWMMHAIVLNDSDNFMPQFALASRYGLYIYMWWVTILEYKIILYSMVYCFVVTMTSDNSYQPYLGVSRASFSLGRPSIVW